MELEGLLCHIVDVWSFRKVYNPYHLVLIFLFYTSILIFTMLAYIRLIYPMKCAPAIHHNALTLLIYCLCLMNLSVVSEYAYIERSCFTCCMLKGQSLLVGGHLSRYRFTHTWSQIDSRYMGKAISSDVSIGLYQLVDWAKCFIPYQSFCLHVISHVIHFPWGDKLDWILLHSVPNHEEWVSDTILKQLFIYVADQPDCPVRKYMIHIHYFPQPVIRLLDLHFCRTFGLKRIHAAYDMILFDWKHSLFSL